MPIVRASFYAMQGSTMPAVSDSAASTTVPMAQLEHKTPENAGYMHIAYTVAAVIYGSYLLILRGRWSALRKRQANNAAQSRR